MEIAVGTPGTQFDIKDAAHTKADGWLPILMYWPVAWSEWGIHRGNPSFYFVH